MKNTVTIIVATQIFNCGQPLLHVSDFILGSQD